MKTKKIALTGLMLSLIVVLSYIENMFPPMPYMPPGVKIGLSNVIIMYSLFFTDKKNTLTLVCFKSLFVFISRNLRAGLLSIGGGFSSILIIILALLFFKNKLTYISLSILGAVFHNMGQLAVLALITNDVYIFWYYAPLLIISGIIMGTLTGILLKMIMPSFNKIFGGKQK